MKGTKASVACNRMSGKRSQIGEVFSFIQEVGSCSAKTGVLLTLTKLYPIFAERENQRFGLNVFKS